MSKNLYETKIVGVGGDVPKFMSAIKMIVLFDDSMILPELRDFSVLHSGNRLTGVIKSGDIMKIAGSEFKIIKIGGEVHNNIRTLGHVIVKFDGGEGELMDGSIHVEDKPIPKLKIGDAITISEKSSTMLKGKTVVINGGDDSTADALKNLFVENGAQIVSAEDADIVIKVK